MRPIISISNPLGYVGDPDVALSVFNQLGDIRFRVRRRYFPVIVEFLPVPEKHVVFEDITDPRWSVVFDIL